MANVKELIGKTLTAIDNNGDELIFHCESGEKYRMHHYQDCCETVTLEDITGDLDNLIGTPIVMAEEATSSDEPAKEPLYDDSYTWTYYKFATNKGYVTLRWYGTSNGYYSESVDFVKI